MSTYINTQNTRIPETNDYSTRNYKFEETSIINNIQFDYETPIKSFEFDRNAPISDFVDEISKSVKSANRVLKNIIYAGTDLIIKEKQKLFRLKKIKDGPFHVVSFPILDITDWISFSIKHSQLYELSSPFKIVTTPNGGFMETLKWNWEKYSIIDKIQLENELRTRIVSTNTNIKNDNIKVFCTIKKENVRNTIFFYLEKHTKILFEVTRKYLPEIQSESDLLDIVTKELDSTIERDRDYLSLIYIMFGDLFSEHHDIYYAEQMTKTGEEILFDYLSLFGLLEY